MGFHVRFISVFYIGLYFSWNIPSSTASPFTHNDEPSLLSCGSKGFTYPQVSKISAGVAKMSDPEMGVVSTGYWNDGVINSKWITPYITYNISMYPKNPENKHLTMNTVDELIKTAFAVWSELTQFRFLHVRDECPPDVDIRFEVGEHPNCEIPFDGLSGFKTHTKGPSANGAFLHFDDDELWTLNTSESGTDFFINAVLGIGHMLGVDNFTANGDQFIKCITANRNSSQCENIRNALRALYSNFDSFTKPCSWNSSGTLKNSLSPICKDNKFSVEAVFHTNCGSIYAVLNENRHVELGPYGPVNRGNGIIKQNPKNLPHDIDAAFTDSYRNFTIIFKGDKYWRYTNGKLDVNYPMNINQSFPDGPKKVDAASVWLGFDGYLYLFEGSQYWIYEKTEFNTGVHNRTRQFVPAWNGIPDRIDAAHAFDAFFYIFRGKYYAKFDSADFEQNEFTIIKHQNSTTLYPRKIIDGWFLCNSNISEISLYSSSRYTCIINNVPGILHDQYVKFVNVPK